MKIAVGIFLFIGFLISLTIKPDKKCKCKGKHK